MHFYWCMTCYRCAKAGAFFSNNAEHLGEKLCEDCLKIEILSYASVLTIQANFEEAIKCAAANKKCEEESQKLEESNRKHEELKHINELLVTHNTALQKQVNELNEVKQQLDLVEKENLELKAMNQRDKAELVRLNQMQDTGIFKLREVIKHLSPALVIQIQSLTDFQVATSDQSLINHFNTSQNAALSVSSNLKASVGTVLRKQGDVLEQQKKAKEEVVQIIVNRFPEEVFQATIKPMDDEIDSISKNIEWWKKFLEDVTPLSESKAAM